MKKILLALLLFSPVAYTAARVTNTDIASNAAIAWSKMASLTSGHVLVGNGSNVASDVALSGDCTLGNTGAITCTKTSGTNFGTLATAATPISVADTAVANQSVGTCTTAATVDWATGRSFTVTLTNGDTCAFTFSNKTSGQTITLHLYQPGTTGSGVASWSSVLWAGGTAPTITTGASKHDVCSFTYNGTDTTGSCVQDVR